MCTIENDKKEKKKKKKKDMETVKIEKNNSKHFVWKINWNKFTFSFA